MLWQRAVYVMPRRFFRYKNHGHITLRLYTLMS